MTSRKQPGRRYGPAPKNPPHEGMQAPEPLSADERRARYRTPLTVAQRRSLRRRNGFQRPAIEMAFNWQAPKGCPTPKQKKVRR